VTIEPLPRGSFEQFRPGVRIIARAGIFSRLEARRPILLPGDGPRSISSSTPAMSRALVAALERPDRSGGEAYNCTHASVITNRGWAELCADVAGIEPWLVPIDEQALGVASDTVDLTDIVFPYPAEHYALDGSKLARDLGVEMTTGNRACSRSTGTCGVRWRITPRGATPAKAGRSRRSTSRTPSSRRDLSLPAGGILACSRAGTVEHAG